MAVTQSSRLPRVSDSSSKFHTSIECTCMALLFSGRIGPSSGPWLARNWTIIYALDY